MGVALELARGILPQNLYTSFWGTANLRNIIHFLNLRCSPHAQWEIRVLAEEVKKICFELFPETMNIIFPET